jgi:ABC-type bacteriocin/lantibiotic exporter with double-glycine peptidase domain
VKYKTNCGDRGTSISRGQKQIISLARAIYLEPEIFMFDESTNSLYKYTEKEILDDIFGSLNEKTIIFISHKIDIINEYCDKIYTVGSNVVEKVK